MGALDDLRAALDTLRRGDVRAAIAELDLPARAAVARARAAEVARRTWLKYALPSARHHDAPDRHDLAYQLPDPWHMASPHEQARFIETNAIIERELGDHFDRILEIGCGEGHQTEYLANLATTIHGLDVSPTAIARARRRVPAAEFIAGDLDAQPWRGERGRFELVTACEVLTYLRDLPRFLQAIDTLGRDCFVTYAAPTARQVEAAVMAMPAIERVGFRYKDRAWVAAWWPGSAARSA